MRRAVLFLAGAALLGLVGLSVGGGAHQAAAGPAQFKKVLNPTGDTYVTEGDPSANMGNAQQLRMGVWSKIESIPYFKFELPPDMPTGATLTKATLRLYCIKSEFEQGQENLSHVFWVSSPNANWNPNTMTWKNQPRLGAPRTEWSVSKCASPNGEWKEADVLGIVSGWYDGSNNNTGIGIEVKSDEVSKVFTLWSKDGQDPYPIGKEPQLVIEYTGGTTPTWTPTITPVPTDTPIPSETPVPSDTPIPSDTPVPTDTPVVTDTPVPTDTPTPTATPAVRPVYLPLLLMNHDLMAPPEEALLHLARPGVPAAYLAACRVS